MTPSELRLSAERIDLIIGELKTIEVPGTMLHLQRLSRATESLDALRRILINDANIEEQRQRYAGSAA